MRIDGKPAIHVLGLLIVGSWIFPTQAALTQEPAVVAKSSSPAKTTSIVATDLKLDAKNCLQGTVMLPGGKPAAKQAVVLGREGKPIGRVVADEQGRFEFPNLKPGIYQVATRDAAALVRCQPAANSTAGASDHLIMSQEAMIARGNGQATLFHPFFVGLVILAAIAIPIAISSNDDDAS